MKKTSFRIFGYLLIGLKMYLFMSARSVQCCVWGEVVVCRRLWPWLLLLEGLGFREPAQ